MHRTQQKGYSVLRTDATLGSLRCGLAGFCGKPLVRSRAQREQDGGYLDWRCPAEHGRRGVREVQCHVKSRGVQLGNFILDPPSPVESDRRAA